MSTPESPLSPVALRHRREHVIAELCEHFARDHLEADELEQLIDHAHRAASIAELDHLLAGLPALATAPAVAPRSEPGFSASVPGREPQLVVAVLGGTERKGAWTPAHQTSVVAFMGGVRLDFREAVLSPGITEVNVLAVMGGVEIIVPPDIHVESSGIGILGGFEQSGQGRFPVDSSIPVLRISGFAFLGGVDIRDTPSDWPPSHHRGRLHDEWRAAKHQMRAARRELRDEARRLKRGD